MSNPTPSHKVQEELDGRRGELFTSRHPSILDTPQWKDKEWFKIREVMYLTQLNGIWVRTQVKDGRWKVRKDEKGRWLIHRTSLLTKLTELNLKDERRVSGEKKEYKDPPPRLRAVKIVRKMVNVDSTLSSQTKKEFLTSLDRYEEHFTKLYKERMDKIKNNKK